MKKAMFSRTRLILVPEPGLRRLPEPRSPALLWRPDAVRACDAAAVWPPPPPPPPLPPPLAAVAELSSSSLRASDRSPWSGDAEPERRKSWLLLLFLLLRLLRTPSSRRTAGPRPLGDEGDERLPGERRLNDVRLGLGAGALACCR